MYLLLCTYIRLYTYRHMYMYVNVYMYTPVGGVCRADPQFDGTAEVSPRSHQSLVAPLVELGREATGWGRAPFDRLVDIDSVFVTEFEGVVVLLAKRQQSVVVVRQIEGGDSNATLAQVLLESGEEFAHDVTSVPVGVLYGLAWGSTALSPSPRANTGTRPVVSVGRPVSGFKLWSWWHS